MSTFREKRWIATVPERISRKFFHEINSEETDYEAVREALIEILNFVKKKVGEDDFYEDSLIDDLEFCDMESDEDADYYINEMYDVLDGYSIFMDPIYDC